MLGRTKIPVTVIAEYIFDVRGVVNRSTMSHQSAVQRSKEAGDFQSSALPDSDKPPPFSEITSIGGGS